MSATGSLSLDALSDAERLHGSQAGIGPTGGDDSEDIDELFDIDWATANFAELEAQWRAELTLIEKDNVTALLESSERGQGVLPALNQALREMSRVEELVIDYTRQLKLMGQEISQLADINQALDVQARNQEALLSELARILGSLEVPEEALKSLLRPDFSSPSALATLERSAQLVYGVLHGRFDRGIKEMRAVAERLAVLRQATEAYETALLQHLLTLLKSIPMAAGRRKGERLKPHRLDAVNAALLPMAPFIQLLGQRAPQRYQEFRSAYEQIAKAMVTAEMAEIIEFLKQTCLINKTPDEKPSFVLSSNRPSSGFEIDRAPKGTDFSGVKPFTDAVLPELTAQDRLQPEQLLDYMLLLTVESSGALFDTVEAIFYPQEVPEAVARVGQILDVIFENMKDLLLQQVVDALLRTDRLSSFSLVLVVERRLPEIGPEIPAMEQSLRAMMDTCTRTALEHIKSQVEAVQESRFSAKKRSGVFPSVAVFPRFVQVLERAVLGAPPQSKARALVNTAYDSISQAIFGSLGALMAEASATEDEKDNLNAAIMTVQNTFALMDDLQGMERPQLEPILRRCKEEFHRNLSNYAALSLPRILGRVPEYFESIQRLLQTGSSPDELAFNAAYDKSAARRVVGSLPLKELRKGIEAIRERVLKHYKGGQDGERLVPLVWQALSEHTQNKVKEYVEIITKVYPASDIQLAFSSEEVATLFTQL